MGAGMAGTLTWAYTYTHHARRRHGRNGRYGQRWYGHGRHGRHGWDDGHGQPDDGGWVLILEVRLEVLVKVQFYGTGIVL